MSYTDLQIFLFNKYDNVKKNICWQITLAATSLTTNPPPSKKRKIHQNIKIVTFLLWLKFWGIQTLVIINFKTKKSYIFVYIIFYTCIPEKVRFYHTGSVFIQHHVRSSTSLIANIQKSQQSTVEVNVGQTSIAALDASLSVGKFPNNEINCINLL